MTKHTVDFEDDFRPPSGGYTGPEPTRGVYEGVLVAVKDHTSTAGNEGLEWSFDITKGEFVGWRGYLYSNLAESKWKTQQIAYAITGQKKSVVIDTDNDGAKMAKKAKPVKLRVVREQYEGEPKAKLKTVLLSVDDDADDEDEDEKDPFAD